MTDATPAMVEMAERIADGMMPHRVLREWQIAKDAALAAIIETQRLDAAEADKFESQENDRAWDKRQAGRDDNFNCARASAANIIATAIRAGQHYGKDTDQ